MTLNVITNYNKSPVFICINPVFVTKGEVDQHLATLTGEQSNLVNSIIDTYGFEVETYVDGDPRKLIAPDDCVNFLGFHNGKFGIIHELPLDAYTESEVILFVSKVSAKLSAEKLALNSKYEHTEFFFTHHEGNLDNGLCLVAFTELSVDEQSFTSPYVSEVALEELVDQLIDIVCGINAQ